MGPVAEGQRRRGVGRRMLEEAEKVLLAIGCAKINLQVRRTNSDVIEFYEGCGFSIRLTLPRDNRPVDHLRN